MRLKDINLARDIIRLVECLLHMQEALGSITQHHQKNGVVVRAHNTCTLDIEAGESNVQGHPRLLANLRPGLQCLKKKKRVVCVHEVSQSM